MNRTTQSLFLQPVDYNYPNSLPKESYPIVKSTVQIKLSELTYAAEHGITWEQLEQYYMVDKDTLQKYLTWEYNTGKATLEINVLDAMVESAVEDKNPVMLKFLATNWLGMTDKTVSEQAELPQDEDSINQRLQALLAKHSKPTVVIQRQPVLESSSLIVNDTVS